MPKEYYLYVNGQRVKVSEEIYKVYWREKEGSLSNVGVGWFLSLLFIFEFFELDILPDSIYLKPDKYFYCTKKTASLFIFKLFPLKLYS